DWNVIFLLFGMMMIVGVIKTTGLFEALAIYAAKRARGRPYPLMVILAVITAVASALLDNVTTVLLIAPVTFLVCERLELKVTPFLIAEVLASNTGGMATLIGDPPNIIIGSRAGLSFNDFLLNLAPLAVIMTIVLVLMMRFMFRDSFTFNPDRVSEVMALSERDAIRDRTLMWQSLAVLALVLAGFTLHSVFHYEPSV
ncbi:MAG: sodium:proton antiporter, partial [Solirubrobacterales bacterium]|nr:sodium:proton antiporter [Solirubrobacterales bacterium]